MFFCNLTSFYHILKFCKISFFVLSNELFIKKVNNVIFDLMLNLTWLVATHECWFAHLLVIYIYTEVLFTDI